IESGRTKETEFAVTGLESGKRYTFSVRAVDGTGHESDRVSVHYPALGIPLPGKRVGSALLA
ncbi:fibronectin type III domain-containing protein, partial [Pseudomonas umsongensis]